MNSLKDSFLRIWYAKTRVSSWCSYMDASEDYRAIDTKKQVYFLNICFLI